MANRFLTFALVMLCDCGRVRFDDRERDSGATAGDDAIDGTVDRPNVAFVTSMFTSADFGSQAAADSICATAATSQSLPGTFVAFVSTTTSDAIDRLTGSRGWIRTDGMPIIDQPTDLLTGGPMFNLIDHDESGARLALNAVVVWTGSDMNGRVNTNGTCSDWTSLSSAVTGEIGFFDRTSPFTIDTAPQPCDQLAHLYCFEIGHVAPVVPLVKTGKFAFYSTATTQGLATFDARCQADAMAANLPGTYLAAVATTTSTIQSRFPAPSDIYVRPDGTQVSVTGAAMVNGSNLLSPVNQKADGTYIATAFTPAGATGAINPTTVGSAAETCSDWTATTGTGTAGSTIDARSAEFWSGTLVSCNVTNLHVLCLEQ